VPALWPGLLRSVAKNAALAVPGVRGAYTRRIAGRGLGSDSLSPSYAERAFRLHAEAAAEVRPVAHADVLEVGPGGTLRVLELFRAAGARRTTAIDLMPWVTDRTERARTPDAERAVEYLYPVSVEALPFPDESFDIIYSTTCLQYVRDPDAAVREIARVTRLDGVTTHLIDMSDRAHEQSDDPLHFLRYRDWQWRLATSHRLFQPNRWRASDYVDAFERNGFDVRLEVLTTIEVDNAYRAALAPRFRDKRLDDLATVGCFITARKRPIALRDPESLTHDKRCYVKLDWKGSAPSLGSRL
jgi:SAM-dependent methyltransferase